MKFGEKTLEYLNLIEIKCRVGIIGEPKTIGPPGYILLQLRFKGLQSGHVHLVRRNTNKTSRRIPLNA